MNNLVHAIDRYHNLNECKPCELKRLEERMSFKTERHKWHLMAAHSSLPLQRRTHCEKYVVCSCACSCTCCCSCSCCCSAPARAAMLLLSCSARSFSKCCRPKPLATPENQPGNSPLGAKFHWGDQHRDDRCWPWLRRNAKCEDKLKQSVYWTHHKKCDGSALKV